MNMFDLVSVGLSFFAIAASPGPANISNAAIAMSRGRKISLVYGAGLSTGLIFWGIIAASGLGVILQNSTHLLTVLKIFAGLYLLWLSFLSIKEAIQPQAPSFQIEIKSKSYFRWFAQGVILNVSNPKTVIAWLAALSAGIKTQHGTISIVLAVLVCVIIGFLTNAMYSLSFSFNYVMNWYQKANKWINITVAGIFAIAGFELIRSSFIK